MALQKTVKNIFIVLFAVVTVWGSNVANIAERFMSMGDFVRADSVFSDFSEVSRLDRIDYMRWIKVTSTLGNYSKEAELLGSLYSSYRNSYVSMRNRFISDLRSSDSDSLKLIAVKKLKRKIISSAGRRDAVKETLIILKSVGLYREFVSEIDSSSLGASTKFEEILSISEKLYNLGNIALSEEFLKSCIKYSVSIEKKDRIHRLLFAINVKLDHKVKALSIFDSIVHPTNKEIAAAIILNCRKRNFDKSKELLNQLPISFSRDTLGLGIMIFKGDWQSAKNIVYNLKPQRGVDLKSNIELWMLRIALFSGDLELLESVTSEIEPTMLNPRWAYTAEILEELLVLKKISGDEKGVKVFGQIQKYRYTGIDKKIAFTSLSRDVAKLLSGKLSEVDLELGHLKKIIDRVKGKQDSSPLERYCLASALALSGNVSESKTILKKIILDNSDTVVSQKARIYLLRMEGSNQE